MEKSFQPHSIEQAIYKSWEQKGYFRPNYKPGQSTYSLVIPPPNVTGTLHMGHSFQYTIMDALARYHRMLGRATLWQPGVDHAGIATQMVVERQLLQNEGLSRHDLGRQAFVDKVWEWKEQSGEVITQQTRRLGASLDWDRQRFTMDDDMNRAVRQVFVQLYQEGLIYRGQRLVNWDPVLQTAISDLEVVNEQEQGFIWHIQYPLVEGDKHVEIATTRPETLFGDAALAVHPDDARFQHLIGHYVHIPLTERTIPIIADDYVEADFGTGCLKITPAHDFNDYLIGQRHELPLINILNEDASLNKNVPPEYQGLDRFKARQRAIQALESQGLLTHTKPYQLTVPRGDRSDSVIEPFLTYQWFVATQPLAEPAIKAVERGDITFIPENWRKTYFQWLENIEDWCISRQLWWGHRIPAWYDDDGHVYVGHDESDVRQHYQLDDTINLTRDPDVLDTWFSSALWPFATLGWPDDKDCFERFYPTDVLVTGFDIIFFWVARMIMFSLKFTGQVPFKAVYVTGLIRDQYGQKMSKSKGNVLDPIDLIDGIDLDTLIEKRQKGLMQPQQAKKIAQQTQQEFPQGIEGYGTDALRFTFCALANNNRDIHFDVGRLQGYRNFCNKLWNAARFTLMNLRQQPFKDYQKPPVTINYPEHWICQRLRYCIDNVHHYIGRYRFDYVSQRLYDFVWYDFCDWYLELSKVTLYNQHSEEQAQYGTCFTLVYILDNILRLLHPIMPFITEAIWQHLQTWLADYPSSLMYRPFPQLTDINQAFDQEQVGQNTQALEAIQWVQAIISAVRNIRGEMNIAPGQTLSLHIQHSTAEDRQLINSVAAYIQTVGKVSDIHWLETDETPNQSATALVGHLELFVPLAELIDIKAEIARLDKELNKVQQTIDHLAGKLNNDQFVNKAPQAIVDKERNKLKEAYDAKDKLEQQRAKLN